jgi:DNA-binding response OmpR family regulator
VLIVEDDPDLRQMLTQILTLEGFDTDDVPNGAEALRRLRSGPAPGVILLDLMMPVMDGWTFRSQQLQDAAIADIPVIVLSAAPRERLTGLNAAASLTKPYDLWEMLALVEQHCRG